MCDVHIIVWIFLTLWTTLSYPFLADGPQSFLKAPLAAIYTILEEGERAEKTWFFGQKFPKSALKRLFGLFFFLILPAAQKILPNRGLLSTLGELGKSNWLT